jgi:hypothetical protein
MSYNLAADSFKWNRTSNVGLRLKLTKSYTLNLNMAFDTYPYDSLARPINTPRWQVGKGLGRLQSTGTNFSYTFDNNFINTIKGWFGGKSSTDTNRTSPNQSDNSRAEDTSPNPTSDTPAGTRLRGDSRRNQSGDYDEDGYYNATIPWSFNISYGMRLEYDRAAFNKEKLEYDYKITHSLSFNGNIQPTSKWRLTFNGSYDFEQKKIPYIALVVSRELHCFQMSANIVPVGPRKHYMFSIAVSSSLLKDLKYNQSSNYWNGLSWY